MHLCTFCDICFQQRARCQACFVCRERTAPLLYRLYFAGINIVGSAILSAVESVKYAFAASIMRGFIAISIFAFALSAAFGMTGVWLAFPAAEFVTMFIIVKGLRKTILIIIDKFFQKYSLCWKSNIQVVFITLLFYQKHKKLLMEEKICFVFNVNKRPDAPAVPEI